MSANKGGRPVKWKIKSVQTTVRMSQEAHAVASMLAKSRGIGLGELFTEAINAAYPDSVRAIRVALVDIGPRKGAL